MKQVIISIISLWTLVSCEKKADTQTPPVTQKVATTATSQTVSFNTQQLISSGVDVGKPQRESVSGILKLQGTVSIPPQGIISVSFPLGGYLKSTDMLAGMRVKKGQVLAYLEDMQFIQLQQDYLTAKEHFSLAVSEFNRQRDLNATKASSDKVFQQAQADLEGQRILMNALGQKLEVIGINPSRLQADNISRRVAIHSPIDGIVAKVNANVGKYTSPTDMLFELVDLRDVHLVLTVFEKDLAKLSIGQSITAYTNSDPSKKYGGEIILINKNLNQDRMAEVQCHFKNYNVSLVPGTFMNGDVAVNNKEALTVPEGAIVRWQNKSYVFTDQGNGDFHMTEVRPGLVNQGRQQIDGKGITNQTNLVIKNAYALLLKIKNAEADE
ncbi:efflux RND transporter periplasmic adaptor subunit [Spirosoma oryzicola]|uniref:efflux RND transporter periplasmic adaptor subunit n=1 Tax=Spirosoma oryzicola TaxID=2898794 RepID=UPI001E46AAD8|nr:efflux RND transporter periplasmic adaptor subunit [Spirosoma oryzicola]UHG94660.1 efflux RND transporter periplasmic adaptor subunit [Spirosoma oryzicola]